MITDKKPPLFSGEAASVSIDFLCFDKPETLRSGDGQRVKSVLTTNLGTTTTYFVSAHYEVTNGVVTKYYYAGSQRIAMRSNGTLYFMLGDHLGSTSLVTFANGNVVSQQYYKAWGETRYASGTIYADRLFTGQQEITGLGIYHYGARFYSAKLGRFLSADTIVPGAFNPQAFNRYSYVLGNPLRYIDPTGHESVCGYAYSDPECEGVPPSPNPTPNPNPHDDDDDDPNPNWVVVKVKVM